MANLARRVGLVAAASAAMTGLGASAAFAQTTLPGVVVTTPSPVAPRRAPPAQVVTEPSPAPARPVRAARTPQAAPPPAPPPVIVAPTAPLPGTLVVVDDAFVPVTVVTDRETVAKAGSTITDVLATKPGIAASTFAPGASRPIIRGLDNYRVRVQENGIGTHDVSALSEDHGLPIDPFAAEQIEVVRGPATLRYGSQAIGGVVNVTNSRIPEFVPRNGFSAEMRGGLNSVDSGRDGGFKVTAGSGNIVVYADTYYRRAEDYDTPRGRQLNSFVESRGYSLGASYVWSQGFVGVSYTHVSSLYGVPGEEAAEERPRIDMQQDKIQSRGEWRVRDHGIEAIRFWLGTSRYGHNEVVFEPGEGDIIGTRFTNREHEARMEVQHQAVRTGLGELRGAVGLQWGAKRLAGFGVAEPVDGLIDPPARSVNVAAFIFEELQLAPRLRLQAAARIESSEAKGTGVDLTNPALPVVEASRANFAPKGASLGLLYELPLGIVARLTGQHTERAPDVAELFSKGVHEATGTFEIGDPGLGIETAQSVELGFKRAKGAFRFDASAFYTRFDGFIFKRFTGETCDDVLASCTPGGGGSELDQLVFSQRDALFRGVELAAQWDVLPVGRGVIGVEGQYDYVRATFAGGGNVPRIPPQRLGFGVYYRDAAWLARVFALHAFDQSKVAANDDKDTPTDGYTMLTADLAYTFKLDSSTGGIVPQMTIGLRGENLLDEEIRNHVSFKKDEVLQPGRTIKLYGTVKLN